jgi:hypothetical protein
MILRWVIFLIFACLFAIWDMSGSSFLPSWLSIRLVVPFAFFCFFTERYRHAFVALLVGAALQDVFRWDGFDSVMLRWIMLYGLDAMARGSFSYQPLDVCGMFSWLSLFQFLDWFTAWIVSNIGIVMGFSSSYSLPDHWVSILLWEVILTMIGYGLLAWSKGRIVRFKSRGYGA